MSNKHLTSKPLFLAKYIPPTPPLESRSNHLNPSQSHTHNGPASQYRSQCPSPTPLFQQLYVAVSHWERVLADSPELLIERQKIIKDLENVQPNKIYHSRDEGDETDDEDEDCSNDTPSPMRSTLDVFAGGRSTSVNLHKNILKMQTSSSTDTKDR